MTDEIALRSPDFYWQRLSLLAKLTAQSMLVLVHDLNAQLFYLPIIISQIDHADRLNF